MLQMEGGGQMEGASVVFEWAEISAIHLLRPGILAAARAGRRPREHELPSWRRSRRLCGRHAELRGREGESDSQRRCALCGRRATEGLVLIGTALSAGCSSVLCWLCPVLLGVPDSSCLPMCASCSVLCMLCAMPLCVLQGELTEAGCFGGKIRLREVSTREETEDKRQERGERREHLEERWEICSPIGRVSCFVRAGVRIPKRGLYFSQHSPRDRSSSSSRCPLLLFCSRVRRECMRRVWADPFLRLFNFLAWRVWRALA